MQNQIVYIKGLNLKIGKQKLTSDLSLTIKKGQRIGITGPSGCGKTTLLKSILRNDISKGSEFEVFEINSELNISYMPQSTGLLPWFSLKKNLDTYKKSDELYEEVLEQFNLNANVNSFPKHLSGGEYQRAILASAIINKPELFIADEPLTELDLSNKWKFLKYWSEKIKEFESSLVLVSHDIETLIYLCDTIIVLTDKPSKIKKELRINTEHPRAIEYLVSEEFIKTKKELLEIMNI
jgi:sulfonate transport system ATP-binding protein